MKNIEYYNKKIIYLNEMIKYYESLINNYYYLNNENLNKDIKEININNLQNIIRLLVRKIYKIFIKMYYLINN